jgi:hypothetical protein
MVLLNLDKLIKLAQEFRELQSLGEPEMDLSADEFVSLVETCEALWAVVRATAKYRTHSSVDCAISCKCANELDAAFETVKASIK